jgi:hypothetical protein
VPDDRGGGGVRITFTWLRLEVRRRWRSLTVLALLVALATGTVLANQPGFDWAKVRALPEVAALTEFPVAFGFSMPCCPGAGAAFPPVDDQYTTSLERPVMLAGRVYDPHRADEVMATPQFMASFGKHVGDTITLRLASPQQVNAGYDGSDGSPPRGPSVRARIVGVGDGRSVIAYIPDHCPTELGQGPEGWGEYHPAALRLADGADLLIHDAFMLPEEAAAQAFLGHAAADYAVGLAGRAGARRVLLAHHKPARTDEELDRLAARFHADPRVTVAAEGQVIDC